MALSPCPPSGAAPGAPGRPPRTVSVMRYRTPRGTPREYALLQRFLDEARLDLAARRGGEQMLARLQNAPLDVAVATQRVRTVEAEDQLHAMAVFGERGAVEFFYATSDEAACELVEELLAESRRSGFQLEMPVLAGDRAAKAACEGLGLKGALVVMAAPTKPGD